jgi:hypothetical protein
VESICTASIALRIMWTHRPHHYAKVGIPSGPSPVRMNYSAHRTSKINITLRISIFIITGNSARRKWMGETLNL